MPLGLQKIKLEPSDECRVPDLSHSTSVKLERGSVATGSIRIKVEAAEPEVVRSNPKTRKTWKTTNPVNIARRLEQESRRKWFQTEPVSGAPMLVNQTSAGGRKKRGQVVQTRPLPVPIRPKIVPSTTVPGQMQKLDLTQTSRNKNLQHSNQSVTVAGASSQFLKTSLPSGYCMQTSLQQPAQVHPCTSTGQQTILNSCQNPIFIQVCGNQLASSSCNSASQPTCHRVVLPQNSVSIRLAGNAVVPGISMVSRNLSVNPQLQLQSTGSTMNAPGSLQIGIPSGQMVQTLRNPLNSFVPSNLVRGSFQNPIQFQIPASKVIQTNSQKQVQFNFPSSQLIESKIQNPIQIQIPSTQLVHTGSQNTVQIGKPSNQLVQNSMQIQISARQVLQSNSKVPDSALSPTFQSSTKPKIERKSPVFIKAKLPEQSITILPSSPLIQNSNIGHGAVETNLQRDSQIQSPNTRCTRSKRQRKNAAKVGRKPRKPKYSTRANANKKLGAETQKSVSIQPYPTGTSKFVAIQPSVKRSPQQSTIPNSLQVQVVNRSNVLHAVEHPFPLQLGVHLGGTMSNPGITEKPAVIQVAEQRLAASQLSTSTFRIVPANNVQPETSGATIELRLLDSSKSPARAKLRGRALQQITAKIPENSAARQLNTNTSDLSQKRKLVLPKRDSSTTNLQSTLQDCNVAQPSNQLTVSASSLPTYTIVTSGRQLQPNTNLPNAQVLGTCSQISAHSDRSLQGMCKNIEAPDRPSKETIFVLRTSNVNNKSSDTQCFSVSMSSVTNTVSQSTKAVPQCKAKTKYVPILPRSSDNQTCIFNQTANDKGDFWGAGKKGRRLAGASLKRTSATVEKSDDDEQQILADEKCFVQLEMLNIEPNKFYSARKFKRIKS